MKWLLATSLCFFLGLQWSSEGLASDSDPSHASILEVHEMSADVLNTLMKKYGNDPAKLQEVLLKAQKDPEAFANSEFTAEQRAKLKSLGSRLPAKELEKP
jgi:hypothetical protein